MRRKSFALFVILAAVLALPASFSTFAATNAVQDQSTNDKKKLNVPQRGRRRHRDSKRHSGIKHTYGNAGKSAGHGAKSFGKNVAHGKPVKGGKALGKGMGHFGKGVGKGTAQTSKKIGKKIKHAVTP